MRTEASGVVASMPPCVCMPACRAQCAALRLPAWRWLAATPPSVFCASGPMVTRSSG
uniref:Uncharacterized protein n=1 Tax=Fagus sylvatica TaxID=28930 RepID=A0A2N9GEU6_FAGSY